MAYQKFFERCFYFTAQIFTANASSSLFICILLFLVTSIVYGVGLAGGHVPPTLAGVTWGSRRC